MKKKSKQKITEKKDFRVVLVHLNGVLNMTSAGLHSFLEQQGYTVYSVFFRELNFLGGSSPTEKEMQVLQQLLKTLNPSVIGMSVQSMSFWDCVDITKELKKSFSCPLIWGGIQPMIDPERCLEHADVIVRGEAEEAMVELFENMRKKKSFNKVKNLWVKDSKGKLHKNEYRPLIQNLDILPFPDYSDKNKFYVIDGVIHTTNPIPYYKYHYNITTSRGCPMRCTFCFEHVLNREFNFKYLRRRSVDNVIAELQEAVRQFPDIKHVSFWDNIFTMDKAWVKEFSEKYGKEIHRPFFCYGHASLIKDPEMIQALYAAGMRYIFLGMQSGAESVRKGVYKRSESNDDLRRAAQIITTYAPKAELRFDTIMSDFETPETLREGISFLLTLPKPFQTNKNQMAYYLDFDITREALERGFIQQEDIASVNREIRSQVAQQKDAERKPFINYYYMVGRRYVPNWFLRLCLQRQFESRYPKAFSNGYKLFNLIDTKKEEIKRLGMLLQEKEFGYIVKKVFGIETEKPLVLKSF